MIPIKKYGRFFNVDQAGFLINDTSLDHIQPKYKPLLTKIILVYQQELGDSLHSVYLRGTLARGLFIEGISDIDTFALIYQPGIKWKEPDWAKHHIENLRNEFNFCNDLEIMLSSFTPNLDESYPALANQIRLQSLCVYGHDISQELTAIRIGPALMSNFQWLEEDLAAFQVNRGESNTQQLMKTTIRTGFELVMERVQKFTPDLYLCYESFSQLYATNEPQMRLALTAYLNPTMELHQLDPIIHELIPFLLDEIDRLLN